MAHAWQAVRYGDLGTVKEWIEYNSRKQQQNRNHGYDKYGFTPIHYAAKFNQLEIIKLLYKKGNAGIDNLWCTARYHNNEHTLYNDYFLFGTPLAMPM